jgi:hypothetical protein
MPKSGELPEHVREYLESRGVEASRLPENVLETFASLSTREIAFLAFIGAELKNGGVDNGTVARIH